jgi:RimJ/RimL family protein N-acetyltransferase
MGEAGAVISTERLDLHPLPLSVIEALLARDVARAQARASFHVRLEDFAEDDHVLAQRRDQLRADPAELPWLYRAAVLRSTGEVVARGGFHAPPDRDGTVEVGYRVVQAHRRQGYATELVAGLLGWARTRGAVRCLGSTSPDNVASQAVLARLGFVRTGEQMDEVDGLEHVFTLELGALPVRGAPR